MGSEATPLEASLAKLASAAELLGLADVAGQVGEAARRLAGLELEVAVVGEFKRGKSTLLNALLLDEGVRLVDTPGVGSVLEHNTRATDAYLPSLDAAILVTSADPPISRGERAFLGRVAEQAVRLFVVLNKADYLSGEELRRTVEFTGRVVGEVVPAWPGPVYPLSARPGVGDPAGLARFAKDLRRFLERERAAAVTDAATQSGRRALGLLALALDLERRAAELPAEEITRRRGAFDRAAAAPAEEHAADEALLEAAVRRAMAALDQTLEPHRAALRSQAARATVEAAERHPELGPVPLLERLEAERPALLERLAGPLLDRAEAAALAAYANAIGPVVDRAGARLAQLHQEAASAFEVCLPAFTPPEVDTTVGSVGVATPRVTHLADELVAAAWRLRGRRGARERAVTRARAAAASDADALVGRLRGATSMTLGEASRRLAGQLRRHQRELAGSLRAAVDRGGALLEAAERDRTNRQATLDQVAALLQQAEAALSPVDQDGPGSCPGRGHAGGATATPGSAASSARPPPAVQSSGPPGRPAGAAAR